MPRVLWISHREVGVLTEMLSRGLECKGLMNGPTQKTEASAIRRLPAFQTTRRLRSRVWKARDRGPCTPLYQPQVLFRWKIVRCGSKILCNVIVLLSCWAYCNLSQDQFQDLHGRVALGTL